MVRDAAQAGLGRLGTMCAVALVVAWAVSSIGIAKPVALSLAEVVAFLVCVTVLVLSPSLRIDAPVAVLGVLLSVVVAEGLLLPPGGVNSFLSAALHLAAWMAVFVILAPVLRKADAKGVIKGALWVSTLLAVLHLAQLASAAAGGPLLVPFPEAVFYRGLRWTDPSGSRPAAVFSEVAWYGGFQGFVLFLALVVRAGRDLTPLQRGQLLLVAVSVFLSGSLAGQLLLVLAVAGAVGTSLSGRRRVRLAAVVIGVIGLTTAVAPGTRQLLVGRLTLARHVGSTASRLLDPIVRTRAALARAPLVGLGLGNEERTATFAGVVPIAPKFNNAVLYFLATTGVLGFVLVAMLVATIPSWSRPLAALVQCLWILAYQLSHGDALLHTFWIPLILWYTCVQRDGAVRVRDANDN